MPENIKFSGPFAFFAVLPLIGSALAGSRIIQKRAQAI